MSQAFTVLCVTGALIIATPLTSSLLLLFIALAGVAFLRVVRPLSARISVEVLDMSQKGYNATFRGGMNSMMGVLTIRSAFQYTDYKAQYLFLLLR